MRPSKPNVWSLGRSRDLLFLSLGTAIGIGNSFVMPSLVIYAGGLTALALHVVSLILLGAPLMLAEMLWSRWLLRPYSQSFKAVSANLAWVPLVSILAILFLAPPYFVEVGRIGVALLQVLWNGGTPLTGMRSALEASQWLSFAGAVGLLSVCACTIAHSARRLGAVTKALMVFALPAWALLAFKVMQAWGADGLARILYWQPSAMSLEAFVKVTTFSLFSLSAGIGVLYVYVYYASQPSWKSESPDREAWLRPGSLPRIVAWVVLGDLAATVASLVVVSPYGLGAVGPGVHGGSPRGLMLEWVPDILIAEKGGGFWVSLHLAVLLAAGTAAALSLFDWSTFYIEREMKWPRRKAVLHIWVLGVCLMTLPLIPALARAMSAVGSDFLLPLSALFMCYAIGWRMPERAQRQIFGRGLVLDRMFLLWRFCIRYLTPSFLVYILYRQF